MTRTRFRERNTVMAALIEALEEHDLDRPLSSVEREMALVVLAEHGIGVPAGDTREVLGTIRRCAALAGRPEVAP